MNIEKILECSLAKEDNIDGDINSACTRLWNAAALGYSQQKINFELVL